MAALLQTKSSDIEMTFRWSSDVNHVRAGLIQKLRQLGEAAFHREAVIELLSHQRLTIAHSNDLAVLDALDLQGVEVGDFAAADDGDFKHIDHSGCRLRCTAASLRQWRFSGSIPASPSIFGWCNVFSSIRYASVFE